MTRLAPGRSLALYRPAEAMFPREAGPGAPFPLRRCAKAASPGRRGAGRSTTFNEER